MGTSGKVSATSGQSGGWKKNAWVAPAGLEGERELLLAADAAGLAGRLGTGGRCGRRDHLRWLSRRVSRRRRSCGGALACHGRRQHQARSVARLAQPRPVLGQQRRARGGQVGDGGRSHCRGGDGHLERREGAHEAGAEVERDGPVGEGGRRRGADPDGGAEGGGEAVEVDGHTLDPQARDEAAHLRQPLVAPARGGDGEVVVVVQGVVDEAGERACAELHEDAHPVVVQGADQLPEAHRLEQVAQRQLPERLHLGGVGRAGGGRPQRRGGRVERQVPELLARAPARAGRRGASGSRTGRAAPGR